METKGRTIAGIKRRTSDTTLKIKSISGLRDGSVVNISFKNSEVPMSVPSTYIGLLTFTCNLSFKDLIPSSGLHDRPNTHELHLKGHMYTSTNINKSVLKICLKSLTIQRTHKQMNTDNPSI